MSDEPSDAHKLIAEVILRHQPNEWGQHDGWWECCRRKPTAYTETGASERVCPDCSAPEGHPCRWIAMDGQGDLGKPRHWPHETRWRK